MQDAKVTLLGRALAVALRCDKDKWRANAVALGFASKFHDNREQMCGMDDEELTDHVLDYMEVLAKEELNELMMDVESLSNWP